MFSIEQVARVCHEANREYCFTLGDRTQKPWDEAEEWQRESARKGVKFALDNPFAPPSAQHDAWLLNKEQDGWKFGLVKDPAKKEHPCMVPYIQLSIEQKVKDRLFRSIVSAFLNANNQ